MFPFADRSVMGFLKCSAEKEAAADQHTEDDQAIHDYFTVTAVP